MSTAGKRGTARVVAFSDTGIPDFRWVEIHPAVQVPVANRMVVLDCWQCHRGLLTVRRPDGLHVRLNEDGDILSNGASREDAVRWGYIPADIELRCIPEPEGNEPCL